MTPTFTKVKKESGSRAVIIDRSSSSYRPICVQESPMNTIDGCMPRAAATRIGYSRVTQSTSGSTTKLFI